MVKYHKSVFPIALLFSTKKCSSNLSLIRCNSAISYK